MTGRLIIVASEKQEGYEMISDVYQWLGIDGVVTMTRNDYPQFLCKEPIEEEVKGEVTTSLGGKQVKLCYLAQFHA